MEISGKLQNTAAFSLRKGPVVPIGMAAPHSQSARYGEKKISLPC
jgi:hypothetical protein